MPVIHVKSMPGHVGGDAADLDRLAGGLLAGSQPHSPGAWIMVPPPGVGDASPVSAPVSAGGAPVSAPVSAGGGTGRPVARGWCSRFFVTAAGRQGDDPGREERDDRESPPSRPPEGCQSHSRSLLLSPVPPNAARFASGSADAPSHSLARQSGSSPCRLCPAVRCASTLHHPRVFALRTDVRLAHRTRVPGMLSSAGERQGCRLFIGGQRACRRLQRRAGASCFISRTVYDRRLPHT